MEWTPERKADLRARWHRGDKTHDLMRHFGVTRSAIRGMTTRENLPSRSRPKPIASNHPAILNGTTVFRGQVQGWTKGNVFKEGHHVKKLGYKVTKGRWRDYPLYALTLEERATCPRDCAMWSACYGNHMNLAVRYAAGPWLEKKIWNELNVLQMKHARGFVVRLHILGDFYSESYVDMWEAALDHFPALNVFGYTARPQGTPIGDAIHRLRSEHWERFSVRTSGAPAHQAPRAMTIERGTKAPANVVVCPEQTGRVKQCANCGLCWHTQKTIAFLLH